MSPSFDFGRAILSDGSHQMSREREPSSTAVNGVLKFTFERDQGEVFYDYSGSGNNGGVVAANNLPAWSSADGGIRDFDGIDDYITLGNLAYLDGTGPVTIMAWVYHNDNTTDNGILEQIGGSAEGILFWKDDSAGGRTDTYSVRIENTAGSANITINGANNAAVAGVWHHVAISIDVGSANGLRLYVEGVEDANSPSSLSTVANKSSGGASCFLGGNGVTRIANGFRDDVRIYNKILSAAEILTIKNNTQH